MHATAVEELWYANDRSDVTFSVIKLLFQMRHEVK